MSHLRLIPSAPQVLLQTPRVLRLSGHSPLRLPPLDFAKTDQSDENLLLVQSPESLALINRLPRRATIEISRFAGLTKRLLSRTAPDRVLFPLMSEDLDAAEVAARLLRLRYAGQALVLAPSLPDPQMVEAELHANAPGLRLALMMIDD